MPRKIYPVTDDAGYESFSADALETQLAYLQSRQAPICVRENSALDRAIKFRKLRRWVRRLFSFMDTRLPHVSFSAIQLFATYLNIQDGPLLNYVWHGYACIWIAMKMETDTDLSAAGVLQYLGIKSKDARVHLIEAEQEVSSALGYRFSMPKVSDFAYIFVNMLLSPAEKPEHVLMDVLGVLQRCNFVSLPSELAAAAVFVRLPHTLHTLTDITQSANIAQLAKHMITP